jgi:hypothetical protein
VPAGRPGGGPCRGQERRPGPDGRERIGLWQALDASRNKAPLFAVISERRAQVASRALSPQQRAEWLAEQHALDRERQAARALEAARARRDALVREFDQISRLDLGVVPTAAPSEDWDSTSGRHWDGLSARDRDR